MTKALAFVDPDKVSATVVLTALNRFLQAGAQFTCPTGTKVQILTPEAGAFFIVQPTKKLVSIL
jgi:hypothetical protein